MLVIQMILAPILVFANATSAKPAWQDINKIYVSEKPLGAKCTCVKKTGVSEDGITPQYAATQEIECKKDITHRLYECTPVGVGALIQGIVSWTIQIALLLGVVATAALGIVWAVVGNNNAKVKQDLKNWLVGLIVGLILIYGFQYILGIFGWIYKTNL